MVIGICGASGVIYGIRLLEVLRGKAETLLIVSGNAKKIIELETNMDVTDVYALASCVYENDDFTAPISSGSCTFDCGIIAPCSMKTLASIANGVSSTLIARVADVCLKEGRKLVLMPRETPLGLIHLENLVSAKRAGAIILPACPAFYIKPESITDLVDFIVGRMLDCTGMEHDLYERWG